MKIFKGDRIKTIHEYEGIAVASVEDGSDILITYYCEQSASTQTIKPNQILDLVSSADQRARIVADIQNLIDSGDIRSSSIYTDFTSLTQDELTSVPECDQLLKLVLGKVVENDILLAEVATCSDYQWTVDEVADASIECLDSEEIENLKLKGEADLIRLHHTFGRWIRNTFLLWYNKNLVYPENVEVHPDSFSMEVIRSIHKKINA